MSLQGTLRVTETIFTQNYTKLSILTHKSSLPTLALSSMSLSYFSGDFWFPWWTTPWTHTKVPQSP